MRIFANNLQPITLDVTTLGYKVGTLKDTDTNTTVASIAAFSVGYKAKVYLNQFLQNYAPLVVPDFDSPYIISSLKKKLEIQGIAAANISIELMPGVDDSIAKSSELFNTIMQSDPYQKTYFLSKNYTALQLFARFSGKTILLETIENLTADSFLTVNWHYYYHDFPPLSEVELIVATEELTEIVNSQLIFFEAQFVNFPITLIFRNQHGFFECVRCTGVIENSLQVSTQSLELEENTRQFYKESYEKLSVQTGNITDYREREALSDMIRYAIDVWQYKDGQLIELENQTKDFSKFKSTDVLENSKLEFRYTKTTRLYR